MQDPMILILADGDSQGAISNAKGHLFEDFLAQVLHNSGYEKPRRENLNVTSNGVELDISLRHAVDQTTTVAECKAYTAPVRAEQLAAFYGKLCIKRMTEPDLRGLFVAIPRLTADGHEQAAQIGASDKSFRVLTAATIWDLLTSRGQVSPPSNNGRLVSDHAVVVHSSGIYAAALEIDPDTKTASRVLVQAKSGGVHQDALNKLSETSYAQGLPVLDCHLPGPPPVSRSVGIQSDPVVVEVLGSSSDFEYQLPASPKFFVGRRKVLKDVGTLLSNQTGLIVLNAQSGWGKSSLALKIAAQTKNQGGHAVVIDARTAVRGGYVAAVLRHAAESAQKSGLLRLQGSATWATLASSLKSLKEAQWSSGPGQLVVFFDQFENVFRDEELTREFRDLALWSLDRSSRLVVGFAWKTDYVGWTENHPYQLRDEIRGNASILALEPFGAPEVDTLLKRLEKQVDHKLSPEIRQRLREYSQGLPWLLKKLSGHLIKEFQSGKTQEQLVAEALNVANLFESDLATLNPAERESLNFVARYAPIQAAEVTERFTAGLVQSLLDQRLIVQVGEKLDTYWDTFRDYLTTGRAPIEDSYILRQTPGSVSRLVSEVLSKGGDTAVSDVTSAWQTSENVVWNVARELRQLGLAGYVPNRIQLVPEIVNADEIEVEIRRRVVQSLRRHRAFSAFSDLAERGQGETDTKQFARRLKSVFPAVDVADSTWTTYARVFVAWFEYAGLATSNSNTARIAPEGTRGKGSLVSLHVGPRAAGAFPTTSPGPAVGLLNQLAASSDSIPYPTARYARRDAAQLIALNAVSFDHASGTLTAVKGLIDSGSIDKAFLKQLLEGVPGGKAAMECIEATPEVSPQEIGELLHQAYDAKWAEGTVSGMGKNFKAWAAHAGVKTARVSRKTNGADSPGKSA